MVDQGRVNNSDKKRLINHNDHFKSQNLNNDFRSGYVEFSQSSCIACSQLFCLPPTKNNHQNKIGECVTKNQYGNIRRIWVEAVLWLFWDFQSMKLVWSIYLDQGTWVFAESLRETSKSRVRISCDWKNLWFDILNLEIDLENRDGSVHQDFKSKIKLTFTVPSSVSFIPDWSRKSLDLVQEKFQFNQNKLGTVG